MTECPALTKLTPDTIAITKELVTELRLSTYDRSPGTQVTLSCQFDFELTGPSVVTCGNNGQWSATPTCQAPGTTATTSDSSGLDDSTILLIVLIVVCVFVLAVIIIICVALYYGKLKRRREKSKTDGSYYGDYGEGSTPYSIELSERNDTSNVAMYNIYNENNREPPKSVEGPRRPDPERSYNEYYRPQTYEHRHENFDDKKRSRYYRSYDDIYADSFRYQDLHMDEPYENRLSRPRDDSTHNHHHYHHERLYEKNPKGSRSPQPRMRRYTSRCPNCSQVSDMRHAKSADDITTDREDISDREFVNDRHAKSADDITTDREDISDREFANDRPYFRRDHYLWRSMDANWSNNIPRPSYYEKY